MENEQVAQIPYFAHEGEMVRMERANKRLWIVILVLIIALVGTNAGWIVYESQFVDEQISIEQDGETDGGGNNYFNGTGELMIYGESESADYDQAESP